MKSRLLLFSFLAVVAVICTRVSAADNQYTIAVIPKGTTHEFWKSIHAGAIKAQQEFAGRGISIDLIWKGPLREDDRDQQIQVVENFVARRVNGIVLAPLDSRALIAPVDMAIRSKIPVVIIDSALNSERPASYVATDNFKGGQLAAQSLGSLLKGKGKVLMLRYQVGSASTEQREAGFLDVMLSKFPNIALVSTNQYGGATRDTAYQAAQNLLNRFGREIDGIFCCNESVTVGMLLALKDSGRAAGKIQLVGFDASTQLVNALKAGDIQALVVQNPLKMGYLGVKTLVQHLEGQKIERVVDTGVQLVTQDNMNDPEIKELLNPPLDKYLK